VVVPNYFDNPFVLYLLIANNDTDAMATTFDFILASFMDSPINCDFSPCLDTSYDSNFGL
jgi:hypothetical protein